MQGIFAKVARAEQITDFDRKHVNAECDTYFVSGPLFGKWTEIYASARKYQSRLPPEVFKPAKTDTDKPWFALFERIQNAV